MVLSFPESGSKVILEYYEDRRENYPALNFIYQDLSEPERKKTVRLLERIKVHGLPQNDQKFKKLREDLYEIKPTNQVRLICYMRKHVAPMTLVILFGIKKKASGLKRSDINRAENLIRAIKGQGSILP